MINDRRLAVSLGAGLVPLLCLALLAVFTPTGALGLAGDVNSPGARVALDDLRINRLSLSGVEVEGSNTTLFDIGAIEGSQRLIIERDVDTSTVVPGSGIYTLRLSAPTATADGVELFASRACTNGVGITNFGLFGGLLDPLLNPAIEDGFEPGLITGLVNLIGPLGIVNFSVDEFRAETVRLDAESIRTGGLQTTFGPRTTDPVFAGSCIQ